MTLSMLTNWLSIFFSAIGVGLSVYLVIQVKRIEQARVEERRAMRELMFIDEIEALMGEASTFIQNPQSVSDEYRLNFLRRLQSGTGKIVGSKNAIAKLSNESVAEKVEVVPSGYYQTDFFEHYVKRAQRKITIIAHLNRRLAEWSILEVLALRARAGVPVTIMSISESCSDEILNALDEKLPTPFGGAEDIRAEIRSNTARIGQILGGELDKQALKKFWYLQYCAFPTLHLIQVDDTIYFNIENPRPDQIKVLAEDRTMNPCICVSVNSKLGQFLNTQIEWYKSVSEQCPVKENGDDKAS